MSNFIFGESAIPFEHFALYLTVPGMCSGCHDEVGVFLLLVHQIFYLLPEDATIVKAKERCIVILSDKANLDNNLLSIIFAP